MNHDLIRPLILVTPICLLLRLPARGAGQDAGSPPAARPSKANAPAARPATEAQWIWADQTRDRQTLYFRGTFEVRSPPRKAVLYVTADDSFTAYLNSRAVGESKPDPADGRTWKHVRALDLRRSLLPGLNAVAIRATNATGAAGLIARVELDGKPALVTDGSWKVTEDASLPDTWTGQAFSTAAWKPARIVAPLTGGPWKGDLEGWPGYPKPIPPGSPPGK